MTMHIQYAYITSAREALLDYCSLISGKDFLAENSSFGNNSIRNLLVHIGNTYEYWIGQKVLRYKMEFTESESVLSVKEAKAFFLRVDELVGQFLEKYSSVYLEDLEVDVSSEKFIVTPLKLFTHVITHEFHHKGQILSLSRLLGYIPVDTDVIR